MVRTFPVILAAFGIFLAGTYPVSAEYFRQKESNINPNILKIDEKEFMGSRLDPNLELVNDRGETFRFRDLDSKPTILVWSYYRCDGSCSSVNSELVSLLKDVEKVALGQDFQVLTLSFDPNDNQESLLEFKKHLAIPEGWKNGWTFALFKDTEQIKPVSGKMGFRYFWTPQDRTFFHPNVFIFLSPQGRVTRYLYALTNTEQDVELAILEAKQGQFKVNEVINFVVGLCYSYNYKEGRYTYNIPLFVGAGSLATGILLLIGSIALFRYKKSSGDA